MHDSHHLLPRARVAVSALFFTNGLTIANLAPRYPEIKAALELDNTTYGLAIAAMPVGAILAGLGAAGFIRRWGSARVAVYGTLLATAGIALAGSSAHVLAFALALLVVGALDSIVDVAQNAHGLRVQRGLRRSIINSFHALWSAGAVTGGLMAAGAIALGIPLTVHLVIAALLISAIALVALRSCLPGHDRPAASAVEAHEDPATRPTGRVLWWLAALSLIAIAGAMVEDVGSSWATLYLRDSLGTPEALAAFGFITLAGAQFLGRLAGDPLTDRWGARNVARAGGLLAALGMILALAMPSTPLTLLGYACAGFGIATTVPAAMEAADNLPGLPHGVGLTVVSWLLRVGFLVSPPLIGMLADNISLRVGLLTVPVVGAIVILAAGALPARRR